MSQPPELGTAALSTGICTLNEPSATRAGRGQCGVCVVCVVWWEDAQGRVGPGLPATMGSSFRELVPGQLLLQGV